MEDVINSNHPKQEEYLSRLLNEQDFVQNLITTYELFESKQMKFPDFHRKVLGFLHHSDKYQTPGSIIQEVPEHMENIISASARKDDSKSDVLKATNLDIANQKNKEKSLPSFSKEELKSHQSLPKEQMNDDSLRNHPKDEISSRLKNEHLDKNNDIHHNDHKEKEQNLSARMENADIHSENQFMKEAEEQFEQEVSMTQFKKVNLSQNNERESFSGKLPQGKNKHNDNDERQILHVPKHAHEGEAKRGEEEKNNRILDGLEKEDEKKSSFMKNSKEKDYDDHLRPIIKDIERKYEEKLREMRKEIENIEDEDKMKSMDITSIYFTSLIYFLIYVELRHIIGEKDEEIKAYNEKINDLESKLRHSLKEKDVEIEKLSNTLSTTNKKNEVLSQELMEIKNKFDEQSKYIQSLKNQSHNSGNKAPKNEYNSPASQNKIIGERLSGYQDSKNKFEKGQNFNALKYSNASTIFDLNIF